MKRSWFLVGLFVVSLVVSCGIPGLDDLLGGGTTTNAVVTNTVTNVVTNGGGGSGSVAVLVAEYLFDGNANDSSGNKNDGVLRAPKWYSPPFLTNGRKGIPQTAYYFPGREEINVMGPHIDCGNGPSITNIQDELTVSLWIKPAVLRTRNLQIIGRESNPLLGGWGIWINMDGKLLFNLSKDGEAVELWNSKVQLTTDRFYHIVAMYDRKKGVASVYIDNKKQTWENLFYSLTYPVTPNSIVFHEDHLMIGGFWGCGISYFEGIIDDVRIYNRILTDEEVEALYRE